MTNRELLEAYREAVLDIHELSVQLEHAGRSGSPSGGGAIRLGSAPGSNNPMAAAMQAMDGIEEMMERKRDELADLAIPVGALMARIGQPRTFMVVQRYYLRAETDADIAREMNMSRCRINQIRNQYLDQIG